MCARLLRSISPLLPPSFPPSRPLILNPFTVLHRDTTRELGSCGYLSVQTYCSRGFDVVPPYRGTTRFCPLYTVWLNMWCLNNLPNPNDQIHTFRVFEQLYRCVSICTFIKSRPEDICCTFKFVDVLQYSEDRVYTNNATGRRDVFSYACLVSSVIIGCFRPQRVTWTLHFFRDHLTFLKINGYSHTTALVSVRG